MRRLCDKAKVKPFGFHAIRHLTASTLFNQGYDVGGDSIHPSAQEPQYNGAVFEEHRHGKSARRPGKLALQTGGGCID
jgi:hypothetical protein